MPRVEPFEKYSDAYDQWFEVHHDLYEAELRTVRLLMPPAGVESMEVGVGSGKFAAPLGIRFGVEPSEKMAVRARERGIAVCRGVAEDLPFRNDRFDLALMVTTICFVDDASRSLKEGFRVLRPGGRMIVGFVDKESELGRRYEAGREKSRFYREAVFFSAGDVLKLLVDAGFGPVTVMQTLIPGEPPGVIRDDYGKGAFVAIRATKQDCPR